MLFKKYHLTIIAIIINLQACATDTPIDQEKRFNHSSAPAIDPFANNSSVQRLEKEISIDAAEEINDTKTTTKNNKKYPN